MPPHQPKYASHLCAILLQLSLLVFLPLLVLSVHRLTLLNSSHALSPSPPLVAPTAARPTPHPAPQSSAPADLLRFAASRSHPLLPNLVLVSVFNHGFRSMALNLHLSSLATTPPIRNLVFFATDPEAYSFLSSHHALVYLDPSFPNLNASAQPFRSKDYSDIVATKSHVALKVISLGFDVLIVDVDTFFLRNPLYHLVDLPRCDLVVTLESNNLARLTRPIQGRYSERNFQDPAVPLLINTGIILWRATAQNIALLGLFHEPRFRTRRKTDDQFEFNRFMARDFLKSPPNALDRDFVSRHTTCSVYHGTSTYILSPVLFCTTNQFRNLPARFGVLPYMVHFTNVADKVEAMRNASMWLV